MRLCRRRRYLRWFFYSENSSHKTCLSFIGLACRGGGCNFLRSKLQKQTLQFKSIVIYPHHFCKGRERRFTANLQSFSFLSCGGLPAGVNLCIFSQSGLWGTGVPQGFLQGRWPLSPMICRRSTLHPCLTMRGGGAPWEQVVRPGFYPQRAGAPPRTPAYFLA